MKNIIYLQKQERDKLLGMAYIERAILPLASGYLESRPIKLITGPRRAGKSVLALQMLKGKNFAYLNFDDKQLLDNFDENAVEQALYEVYPDYEYLLLDELQNLPGWSLWVEKLYRRGVNMVITGSNANMLSDDLAAVLSGRFFEINLYPFSANEYLEFQNVSQNVFTPQETASLNTSLDHYMKYGGYPEVLSSPAVVSGYLSSLYDAIVLKDIVLRFKVRKVDDLYEVASWLLSNFTCPFSVNSLARELGMSSITTVQKFAGYLQNTYLFRFLPRFNNKLKLMKKADQKCYIIDNGFVMARAFELSENRGKLLENLVFLELLKRGYRLKSYELFYYRSANDREVDFVCRKGVAVEKLVQVCYSLDSYKVKSREISAMVECSRELHNTNLCIITWNQEETVEESGLTIRIIPFRKWIRH